MCREGVSQDRPGFGGLPRQSSGGWRWGIWQGCNPLSNAWGGQGAPSIKATGLQLSMSPLLHNQYWGSSNLLGWPHLSELQESLPGPLCSSWGPLQQGKKPARKAVHGAWKHAKHRHPAREIGGKMMPKETTSGHSRQPGFGTGWAEMKCWQSCSAFLLFCVLCAVAGVPVPALLHRWTSQQVPPESCLGVNHSHSSLSSKPY